MPPCRPVRACVREDLGTAATGHGAGCSLPRSPPVTRRDGEATLATAGDLYVRVVNALGREVLVLTRGRAEAGTHRLRVDTHALPSGVYAVVMTADGFRATRRLVVAR